MNQKEQTLNEQSSQLATNQSSNRPISATSGSHASLSSNITREENKTKSNKNDMVKSGSYPIDQLNLVRDCLMNDFVNAPCQSRAEFYLKLKLGIINDEIIDFFRYGKAPKDLPDDFNMGEIGPDELIIDTDSEQDEDTSSKQLLIDSDNDNIQESANTQPSPSTSRAIVHDQKLVEEKAHLTFLNAMLNLKHGCESKFCPRSLMIQEKPDTLDLINLIFVCDFCFKMFGTKSRMEEHLKTEKHYSASEYIFESTKPVNPNEPEDVTPCESPTESPFSSPTKKKDPYEGRKLAYLKKRSSLLNLQTNDDIAVFCPKPDCRLFMSTNILAGALHFKYAHSANADIEIFSLGKLKRIREVEIEKKHNCPECKQYHKQLVSLVDHLKRSNHFPNAADNEINVFVCPFDDCHFKTVVFFSFKTHLLGHKFFTASMTPGHGEKVMCKVHVYTAPDSYYHSVRMGDKNTEHGINEWERDCERKAIGDLLELHKNQQFNELNKILKQRKDELGPSNLNRCTQFL